MKNIYQRQYLEILEIKMVRYNKNIAKNKIDGVKLEDFTILKVLGRGAFGKVMMVEHKKTR